MPLSFPLVGSLGAGDVAGGSVSGSTIEGVDHVASALGRLVQQFKDKPNLAALITAYATEAQTVETQVQLLSTLTSIDDSFGEQLDVLGRIVGEARQGGDDATYRLHIKARIWANRSSGTAEDLYGVFQQIIPAATFKLEEQFPAAFVLHINAVGIDPTLVVYLLQFMADVKSAGVRAILHWLNDSPANTFCFYDDATGTGFDDGVWSSAE